MELFMQEIMPSVLSLLAVLVGGVFTWIGSALRKYLKEKGIIEKIREKPYIADTIVRSAKDLYNENQGDLKLEYGIKSFVELMQSWGLPADYEDAEIFIRGAYQRMQEELAEGGLIVIDGVPADDIETTVKDVEEDDVTAKIEDK